MINYLIVAAIACILIVAITFVTIAVNTAIYEAKSLKAEEDFEKEFYEAAWEINPFNNDWIEEALLRFKKDYDSYYHNPKAITFLEMMQEKDKKIVGVVNYLSSYNRAA